MAKKQIEYENKSYEISYNIINQEKNPTIVFLHGWASYKELMQKPFEPYLKDFRHIYIDMPGFGKSSNKEILTTKKYAKIIDIFLNHFKTKSKKFIIVGHSFGGKVGAMLSADMLVLLSSAGIVEKKDIKTRLMIKIAKLFNMLGLSKITKLLRSKDVDKMSENMYKTFKNIVDEDFSNIFKNYKKPTVIFWGKDDKATSIDSGKQIHKLIKNSNFYEYEADHYFFIKHSKDIANKIKEQYDKI